MRFAIYIRPENRDTLIERFVCIHVFDGGFEEMVELKQSYTRCMSLLNHPGKIRVVPFPEDETPPTEFSHEDELNKVYEQNRSLVPSRI